ncbi:hypothetical protein, partial [Streptomyces broussonetiae]|uniref:hypothetical protein n=1 Tax=Streptomyces broussonetiae TaxID=2686304 RepID=UPI0035E378EC
VPGPVYDRARPLPAPRRRVARYGVMAPAVGELFGDREEAARPVGGLAARAALDRTGRSRPVGTLDLVWPTNPRSLTSPSASGLT